MRYIIVIALVGMILIGCASVERHRNRGRLERLEMGMTKAEVAEVMGKPRLTERYLNPDSSTTEVWFYYTHRQTADGLLTRDEMTPVCIRDGVLVGYGEGCHLYSILGR